MGYKLKFQNRDTIPRFQIISRCSSLLTPESVSYHLESIHNRTNIDVAPIICWELCKYLPFIEPCLSGRFCAKSFTSFISFNSYYSTVEILFFVLNRLILEQL